MGVAVITSTSGRRPLPMSAARCIHAEPVLLVHHHQPEPLEGDLLLQQRVGADGDAGPPLGHRGPGLALLLAAGRRPPTRATSIAAPGQPGGQGAGVLLGQDLGRHHQRRLPARADRQHRGREGDRGLAAADVPLQEPVHRLRAPHVPGDLRQHPRLRPGELEREPRHRPRQRRGRGVEGDARLHPHPGPPPRQGELQEEELLEDEPPEGRGGPGGRRQRIGAGRGEVDLPQRLGPRPTSARRARTGAGRSSTAAGASSSQSRFISLRSAGCWWSAGPA